MSARLSKSIGENSNMNYYLFGKSILSAISKKHMTLIYDAIDKKYNRFHFEVEI